MSCGPGGRFYSTGLRRGLGLFDGETMKQFGGLLGGVLGLALLGFSLGGDASAASTTPGVEAFLSAPYADDLITAPKSDVVAWTQLLKGERSIWVASAPDFTARRIAVFEGDDGIKLFRPIFSPDAAYVYFVRGGEANLKGYNPNPASLTKRTEQAIWRAPVAGGKLERVVKGASPGFNPATGDFTFRSGGKIMVIEADDMAERDFDAEPLFEARGGVSELSWSPDGSKAVFASTRGDHNFIGVFDPEKPTIQWIAPEVGRDMFPAWSPDGSKIAFIRVPGVDREEYEDFSQDWNFSVWVHDVKTGGTRKVWASPAPGGSLYEWQRTRPLVWSGNAAVAFVSEHDGWLHAYRLDLASGKATDMTPGKCEILQGASSPTLGYLASTNCGDLDRRHIWRVDPATGQGRSLTPGTGIEMNPVPLQSGKWIAYTKSTAVDPQAIFVMRGDGSEARRISPAAPASFPVAAMTTPVSVTFPSATDGATIYGQVFQSDDPRFRGKKRPAIVFLHGGPIRQSVAGWYSMDYYDRFYATNQYLASKGYIVLALNYRAGIGYGRDFRLAEGIGPKGALEYGDVVGGGKYLQGLAAVDGDRIGVYGASYGGYLTALALARNSAMFKAGVDMHGVHDWAWHSATFGYSKGAGWSIVSDEAMALAEASSPVAALDTWRSPVLFIHGDDDENVTFGNTVFMTNALRERGVEVETLIFPDEIHGILRYDTWLQSIEQSGRFFDEHLK